MEGDVVFATGKDLKVGKYVVIDGIPCRVVEIDVSKPGKHGAAKMRITGIGLFGGEKKVLLIPADAEVQVPVIKKRNAQVISVLGDTAQVMDKETYETFDVYIPEDARESVSEGKEVEIVEAMGQRQIVRTFK
ncbi:MAG: translation initiation factor IF-5A [Candidatus Micrarchaeota archaeon]|nr:translation initiation factor IF-5A [Candidatus Micrarchaeota archaeon]MCX8154811.1 translation initiation factor IF-5A [Candidatus Micrarchaeota archaeon]